MKYIAFALFLTVASGCTSTLRKPEDARRPSSQVAENENIFAFRVKKAPFIYNPTPKFWTMGNWEKNSRQEVAPELIGQGVFVDISKSARLYKKPYILLQWDVYPDSYLFSEFFDLVDQISLEGLEENSSFWQKESNNEYSTHTLKILIDEDALEPLQKTDCSKLGFCKGDFVWEQPIRVHVYDSKGRECTYHDSCHSRIPFDPKAHMPSWVSVKDAEYGVTIVGDIYVSVDGSEFVTTKYRAMNLVPAKYFYPLDCPKEVKPGDTCSVISHK